jgi:seryl-tRNA synthetase|tara:strand:- start:1604 stop:2008 length:405 start_codon:yes stop_codon:yes gene_type:complete
MEWIAFKKAASTCWLWVKNHWQIPFIIIWSMLIYFFSRRNSDAIIEVLNARKNSYEKQLNELKKRHNNEIIERDRLIKRYHDAVSLIEKKYAEKEKELSLKEKKRVKQIVSDSKGNPDVIKKEIEKSFGFNFID